MAGLAESHQKSPTLPVMFCEWSLIKLTDHPTLKQKNKPDKKASHPASSITSRIQNPAARPPSHSSNGSITHSAPVSCMHSMTWEYHTSMQLHRGIQYAFMMQPRLMWCLPDLDWWEMAWSQEALVMWGEGGVGVFNQIFSSRVLHVIKKQKQSHLKFCKNERSKILKWIKIGVILILNPVENWYKMLKNW